MKITSKLSVALPFTILGCVITLIVLSFMNNGSQPPINNSLIDEFGRPPDSVFLSGKDRNTLSFIWFSNDFKSAKIKYANVVTLSDGLSGAFGITVNNENVPVANIPISHEESIFIPFVKSSKIMKMYQSIHGNEQKLNTEEDVM